MNPVVAPAIIDAHIVVRFPRLAIDVALAGGPGDIIGIVGANGAGKTTVLRAIAGLEAIDAGRISLDGRTVDDPVAHVFVPPQQRHVGVVFQDYRLFPHLSALDNAAFGLRARGADRSAARSEALRWLERFDLVDHRDHKPAALSGGQAQRVALARVLALEPRVLLLDEPLAAIDPAARARIRDDLHRHLAAFAGVSVLVSHQHDDIRRLASSALLMDTGTVAWRGNAADLPAPGTGGLPEIDDPA